ncbi:MAG: T9SS type A sorting domain-containing protein [Bacteroidetes bacterium]|nr:T9SS type A sorting domain-containing protein [Bacteroidota bacterium]
MKIGAEALKTFFVFLIFTITSSCFSQQWNFVPSPNPDNARNLLRGVWANSSNDVWAVGESGLLPSLNLTEHWDGANWSVINSPSPGLQTNVLNAVQGLSANNVYAVGYKSDFGTPQMMALHWDGSSWTQQSTPTVTGGSAFQCIAVLGPEDIYAGGYKAVGAPGPTQGTLITHWNGSSWNIESTPNQSANRSNTITNIKGLSSNDIWASGYSRTVAGTYKAMMLHKTGSGWDLVTVPQPGLENFLYQIDIVASDNIWVAGQYNDGTQYRVFFLHYNGSSWTVEYSPGGGGGAGIVHNSPNDIWSAGSSFAHYDGTSWNTISAALPNESSMLYMSGVSTSDIWTVGRYYEGNNLKTLTMHYGGTTMISNTNTIIRDYKLLQNYPNPFNPVTNIEFSISKSGYISLKIFDMSGKEITAVVNDELNTGNYKYKFDASNLASGIYFYTLTAENFSDTKSMILLK